VRAPLANAKTVKYPSLLLFSFIFGSWSVIARRTVIASSSVKHRNPFELSNQSLLWLLIDPALGVSNLKP
jgi:hypothetical protein